MVWGHRILPQDDMTLDALEAGLCPLLLDLVIQDSIHISFYMTASAAATRLDRYESFLLQGVHHCRIVAGDTTQFIVNIKLVSITPRAPSEPLSEYQPIVDAHGRCQFRIEIAQWLYVGSRKFMTRRTISRRWSYS